MQNVIWISHRGLHDRHTENTKNAFQAAVDAGFETLETDLRTTVDGHIVLHHDPDMGRTAGDGSVVEQMSLTDFKDKRLQDGQQGLDFEEFIEAFAGLNWIFDIKPESGAKTLKTLQEWAEKHHASALLTHQARFLLWRGDHLKLLKMLFPDAQIMPGQGACRRAGLAVWFGVAGLSGIEAGKTYAVPPRFWGKELFTRSLVHAYHSRRARVLAYLPETESDCQKAIEAGVDEILTNGRPLPDT
jgi:glycerophosphoryl diester phosphodiesterase